jgi:RNA-directed DNA polymerase
LPNLQEDLISLCARNESLTRLEIQSIARTAPGRYYVWSVAKRSGGRRIICHPARELKSVQEFLLRSVLNNLAIHSSATAYVKGSSIKLNAQAHANSRVILKLDFEDFFNNLSVENWNAYVGDHLPQLSEVEKKFLVQMLFWGVRTYTPKCLAIGAPTSPMLSNALLYEIDERLATYAAQRALTYTRYADDITFSSRQFLDKEATIAEVKSALASAKYTKLKLNNSKTALVTKRFARRVTGLTITPSGQISIGRDRKRLISSMVHHTTKVDLNAGDRQKLAGLIAFAQDVEPSFVISLRQKYGTELIDRLLK